MEGKSSLRRLVLARRDRLGREEIARLSAAAAGHLFSLPEFAAVRAVMFFVSFGSEIETLPMIRRALVEGKRVAAPRADVAARALVPCEIRDPQEDLAPGAYNILEPKPHCLPMPLEDIEVVVVPAAVWAEDGYRVGYGGGYYDRFFPQAKRARRIGLGLEAQVVPTVPHGPADVQVEMLVTEAGVRRFALRAGPEESPAQGPRRGCTGG